MGRRDHIEEIKMRETFYRAYHTCTSFFILHLYLIGCPPGSITLLLVEYYRINQTEAETKKDFIRHFIPTVGLNGPTLKVWLRHSSMNR